MTLTIFWFVVAHALPQMCQITGIEESDDPSIKRIEVTCAGWVVVIPEWTFPSEPAYIGQQFSLGQIRVAVMRAGRIPVR